MTDGEKKIISWLQWIAMLLGVLIGVVIVK